MADIRPHALRRVAMPFAHSIAIVIARLFLHALVPCGMHADDVMGTVRASRWRPSLGRACMDAPGLAGFGQSCAGQRANGHDRSPAPSFLPSADDHGRRFHAHVACSLDDAADPWDRRVARLFPPHTETARPFQSGHRVALVFDGRKRARPCTSRRRFKMGCGLRLNAAESWMDASPFTTPRRKNTTRGGARWHG